MRPTTSLPGGATSVLPGSDPLHTINDQTNHGWTPMNTNSPPFFRDFRDFRSFSVHFHAFSPIWQVFCPILAIMGQFYSILAVLGGFLVPRKPWRRRIDPPRQPARQAFRVFSDFRSFLGFPCFQPPTHRFQPPHLSTGPFFADFSLFSAFSGHFSPRFSLVAPKYSPISSGLPKITISGMLGP